MKKGGRLVQNPQRLAHIVAYTALWFVLVGMPLVCVAHPSSNLRAIRRGASNTTLRTLSIGGRLGSQLSFLRTGDKSQLSSLYVGYSYGADMLIPANDFFEIEILALGSWKGGTIKTGFGLFEGSEIPIEAKIRLMSIDMGIFVNYIRRIGGDWDIYGGVGIIPQIEATGRMELGFDGGVQSYDLTVGFDSKAHLFPLNFGVGGHVGARYNSRFALSLWYEHDFLNLLPKQKRFYGAVTPETLMRQDFSLPFIQSLANLRTLAGGISFVYFIAL